MPAALLPVILAQVASGIRILMPNAKDSVDAMNRRMNPRAPEVYRPTAAPAITQRNHIQAKATSPGLPPPVYRPSPANGAPPVFRPAFAQGGMALTAHPNRVRTIQGKFPRPENSGRTQLRWDKAKAKLSHRLSDWNACVEAANSIDELEELVEGKLASSAQSRKQQEDLAKAASKAKHEEHQKEQQKLAEIERERRQVEAEALQKRQEEARAEAIRRIEAAQEPKGRRRLEAVARLLESPDNVCVAVVEVTGHYYAATNQGGLAPLQFDKGTLFVSNLGGNTGKMERTRERDAAKVSASLTAGDLSIDPGTVRQVGQDLPNSVHAEMKLLNWLHVSGWRGTVDLYISKLCCTNCRIAIDEWNKSENQPKIRTPGSHGDYFPGWEFPPCIQGRLRKRIRGLIMGQESDTDTADMRGRSRIREDAPSQRERSYSPAPRDARLGTFTT